MPDPLDWIDGELRALDAQHLRRKLRTFIGPRGVRLRHEGRELVNFGSNDYLDLAADPRLAVAVQSATTQQGWGAAASPLVTGHADLHAELEQRLAKFEHAEAALLFTSGFAANLGTIAALAGPGDVIYSDERNHASIIDGCRLSRADTVIYRHADANHLAELLTQGSKFRRRMIATDSVFSMDGDCAPLVELADLAERFGAMLLVDEAHATGVFGASGSGLCEQLRVTDRVSIRVGTLSKALGCMGGFVAGSQPLVDWLVNRARSYVFSTASPAAMSAAALCALDIVREEPERRIQLLVRAAEFRDHLTQQGWRVGTSSSQIIPIIIGNAAETMRMAAALFERGFLVPGIRPPSVPEGESLLRISLSYGHGPEMLDELLTHLAAVRNG